MLPNARRTLAVLTLINLFNYLDRYVLASVVEDIRRDLGLHDVQLGWLMSGFVIVYMLASPWFGRVGDTGSRPKWMALGVAIWSLATTLGAWAQGFVGLFLARAAVGIGEAAYGTIAPSVIGDLFPKTKRSRVFAIFFMAIPVGSALGYVLGGVISHAWGWRTAFFAAGLPGLLLAFLAYRMPDPKRGMFDNETVDLGAGWLRLLWKNRLYVWTLLGYAAYTFSLGALAYWMPAFLERMRGESHAQATITVGAVAVLTGIVGTLAGGWLADLWQRRTLCGYWLFSGLTTLLAVPFVVLMLTSTERWIYVASLVCAELLIFASTGPVNSALLSVVPAPYRATSTALGIFAIHAFGDVPSPPLIGYLSDSGTLSQAMLVIPVGFFVAALVWLLIAMRVKSRFHENKDPLVLPS